MKIYLTGTVLGSALLAIGLTVGMASPAASASSVMKQCSDKYQAAKSGNTLNGESWSKFYSQCAKDMKGGTATATPAATKTMTAPAATAAPAATVAPATVAPTATKASSMPKATSATGGAVGEKSRISQCGAEWKANKVALKAQFGSWPKYWSACNTRIKTTGK